jgi:hypothetical protein
VPGAAPLPPAALFAACDTSTTEVEVERVGGLTITAPDTLFDIGASVQLTAAVLSPTGALMAGQNVAWSSVAPEIASVSTSGRLTAESPGRTYIRATSGDARDSVVVAVRAGACRAAVAFGTIAAGDNRAGTLAGHDCVLDGYARAYGYQLDLGTRSTLHFELESSDFLPEIVITNRNMNWIGGSWDYGPVATLVHDLPAGQYIVWAMAPLHRTGAYQLRVGPAQFCDVSSATAIALGQTVSGSITETDCFFVHGRRADGHRLSLAQATGVQIQLTSSQFSGMLVVTTLDFDLVGWTEATGAAARLVARLPAGEYLVWATSWQPAAYGAYQLSVNEYEIVPCQPAGTLTLGQQVAGELTHSDCMNGPWYYDDWLLTLAEPTSVRIDLTSSQFDTWLEVRDANGSLVGQDDDGGEGLNSRLILALPAGEYAVRATTFHTGATGSYELLAQLHGGGVPDATSSAAPAGRTLRLEKKR